MKNKHLIAKAKEFAIQAHNSVQQRRKYTFEPYHVHPERVAKMVQEVTDDAEMIAAAWLHDVLEDVAPKNPNFDEQTMREILGERVLQLVLEVTDVSKPEDGNRAVRKELDRLHLAKASPAAQTIKLADLIDNVIDIRKHDRHFAKVFRQEALKILPLLKEGNPELFQRLKVLLHSKP